MHEQVCLAQLFRTLSELMGTLPCCHYPSGFSRKRRLLFLRKQSTALNRTEEAKQKTTLNSESNSLSGAEFVKNLPAALLDMDEYAVKEAIASITSPNIRVQVRLELLRVCLMRLKSANEVTSK